MKLSNKKIKYIKRHASKKAPEAIAKDLRISVKDVQIVLRKSADRPSYEAISTLDEIFHWGLITISFLAPLMFLRDIYDFANLPQLAFIQVGVVFLFLIWLIKGFISKNCLVLKSSLHLPILGFVLWSIASIIYAHNKYEGLLPWMHWAASALMFFLIINGSHEKRRLIQLLAAIFVSGCLCAMLGIAQHLFNLSWVPQVVAPAATFANKNMAAHFAILTFPLAVGFILNSKEPIWDWTFGVVSGLMIVFLLYTQTRAAWVALAVEFLFLAFLFLREYIRNRDVPYWNHNKSLAAGLAFLMLFVMMNLGPQGFRWGLGEIAERTATMAKYKESRLAGSEEESQGQSEGELEEKSVADTSIALRTAIWRNTLEMIKDHPWIGLGLGNHKLFYPLYHRKVVTEQVFSETAQLTNVHNDFLQTFAELGMVGILLLGCICFALARIILRLTSAEHPRNTRFWTIGITVGIVGLLVNSCFSFPFQRAIPPFVLMIFIGILGSFYAGHNRRFYTIRQRWIILFALVIVFVGLVWLIRFHYLGIRCDQHFLHITQLEKMKNWRGVIAEGKKAYRYNPARVKILSYMGRAYIETGEHQKGIEALQKVIAAYPNHMNALLNIGVAYGSIGDNQHAVEAYEKVLRIKPDYSKVHNNMANIYMKQKNLDKALEEFKLAAELDPENSVIHFNVGIVEMQKRRYQEAAEALEKAVRLNPKWDLAQKNLGVVYFQFLNRKKEGIRHLRKALKLNPGIKDAAHIRKLIDFMEVQ